MTGAGKGIGKQILNLLIKEKIIVYAITRNLNDFKNIKKNKNVFLFSGDITNQEVIDKLDHALILKSDSRFKGIEENNEKTIYVDYHPTCENLLKEIVEVVSVKLPKEVTLVYAKMNETANSYSEWFLED